MPIVTNNRYRWIRIDGESYKVPAVLLDEMEHARALLSVASPDRDLPESEAWEDAKSDWLESYEKFAPDSAPETACESPQFICPLCNRPGLYSAVRTDGVCTDCANNGRQFPETKGEQT